MNLAILVVLFVLTLLVSLAAQIGFLWLSSRIWRLPEVTWRKVVGISLVITMVIFLFFPFRFLLLLISPDDPQTGGDGLGLFLLLAMAAIQIALPSWIIKRAYQIGTGRALGTWITTCIGSLVFGIGFAFFIKAYAVEAFVIPTGAMAPTLLGKHSDIVCENCGFVYPVSMSYRLDEYGRVRNFGYSPEMKCRCPMCAQTVSIPEDASIRSGDRILVDKWSQPKRWDLIVYLFHVPSGPQFGPQNASQASTVNYVKRLVALPGETLRIVEGDLFVNQRRVVKQPHELESLWVPVHDTRYQPNNPQQANPAWQPAIEKSVWKLQGDRWECRATEKLRSELLFARPIDNAYSYNPFSDQRNQWMPSLHAVGDVRIRCNLERLQGSGAYGFLWEFDQRRVRTSITGEGEVTMVSESLEDITEDHPEQISGKLVPSKLMEDSLEFAYRDGKAYLSQGTHIIVSLDVAGPRPSDRILTRDSDPSKWNQDQKAPMIHSKLAIFTEDVTLKFDRIRVHRDIYYLAPEDFGGFGTTDASNPITLRDNEYFMMGDNSSFSKDSRFTGPIVKKDFVGVPRWCYWPPKRVRQFKARKD